MNHVLFFLLLAAPAFAADKDAAPGVVVNRPDVAAMPGELTLVDVSGVDADAVDWETLGPAPKNVLPQYKPGGMVPYGLAFATNTPGVWYIVGAASKKGVPFVVRCTVTVGTPTPPPPPPPLPGPTPTDLTATFEVAYKADGPDAASLGTLTSLYSGMVYLAPTKTDLKTTADAHAWISGLVQAAPTGLGTDKLKNLRTAIAAELTKTFGPDTSTTPVDLNALSKELGVIAAALKGVH